MTKRCSKAVDAAVKMQSLLAPSTRLIDRFLALSGSTRVALSDGDGEVSFEMLSALATAESAELGPLQGQGVALLASKSRQWVSGFWSVLLSGGTVVPLSPMYPVAERLALLRQSGARLLLISSDIVLDAEEQEQLIGMGVAVRMIARIVSPSHASTVNQRQLPPLFQASFGVEEQEYSPAVMLFTSETTGRPKGVLLSHHNLYEGLRILSEAWDWQDNDCLLHTLPLHHLHGICVALLLSLLSGTRTILEPKFRSERVVSLAGDATVLMGVPTQHRRLLDDYESQLPAVQADWRERLARYRLVTSGSAKLPQSIGDEMAALTGQYPLERYGMTEIGIVLSNPMYGPRCPGSAGKVLPGVELKIVDEAGEPVQTGQSGEIWVRAGTVFRAYSEDEASTRAAFSDGFFRTGDVARWLKDGYVELLGRRSVDILKSGGYKISALEIEETLRTNPAVRDVAVVGLPDDTWGQKVAAAVVLRNVTASSNAAPLDEPGLKEWLKKRIVGYKVPKVVKFVKGLPHNAMGKVVKTEVVTQFFS